MFATVLLVTIAAVCLTGLALIFFRRRHPIRCIGCGRAEPVVSRLVTGPDVGICPDCIGKAVAATKEPGSQRQHTMGSPNQASTAVDHCSFCHGQRDDRRTLVPMNGGAVCNQCLVLCQEILAEEAAA